ncbi:MAG TPA: prepilin-type N-terminal cleavage/methylation domain-containing protein [Methylomirabilota bacterium]|nr:prepilin-type N-terminal cleavage/methylation domain-containing protein [Methylomirabilota bacterium]
MRNESGVTLIEMFVVVSIIAMASIVVLPFVGTFLGDTKAKAAAQQVASAVRQARQNALTAAATYTVTFGTTTITTTCVDDVPLGNRCPANRPPDRVEDIVTAATMSSASFMLGPLGGATPAGTVQVTYGTTQWEIAVNQIGGVRLCTPQCL